MLCRSPVLRRDSDDCEAGGRGFDVGGAACNVCVGLILSLARVALEYVDNG